MTVAQQKTRLEIRLEMHAQIRRMCLFCGQQTNKDALIAAVYEDNEFTGDVACQKCQGASPALLYKRLYRQVTTLRSQADRLAQILAECESLAMPTPDAWLAARNAYDDPDALAPFEITCMTCGGSHSTAEPCQMMCLFCGVVTVGDEPCQCQPQTRRATP